MPDFLPYSRVKCPHCQTTVQLLSTELNAPLIAASDKKHNFYYVNCKNTKGSTSLFVSECPECENNIISYNDPNNELTKDVIMVIWPLTSGRPPAPPQVPANIAQNYNEASLVLNLSPKASAALSRRCLQSILSTVGGSKKKDLSKQIDDVIPTLPSSIVSNLDFLREIGNFAAHEQKSVNTGAILDVEPHEAEWNLDVLEALFDHYYVRPEIEKKKREEFNKKLLEAGRDPLESKD